MLIRSKTDLYLALLKKRKLYLTYVLIWFFGVVVFPEVEVGDEVGPHGGPGYRDQEGGDVIDGLVSDVTPTAPSLQLARALGAHLQIYGSTVFFQTDLWEINESGTRQEKL